jgi:hypothetical protein
VFVELYTAVHLDIQLIRLDFLPAIASAGIVTETRAAW